MRRSKSFAELHDSPSARAELAEILSQNPLLHRALAAVESCANVCGYPEGASVEAVALDAARESGVRQAVAMLRTLMTFEEKGAGSPPLDAFDALVPWGKFEPEV